MEILDSDWLKLLDDGPKLFGTAAHCQIKCKTKAYNINKQRGD